MLSPFACDVSDALQVASRFCSFTPSPLLVAEPSLKQRFGPLYKPTPMRTLLYIVFGGLASHEASQKHSPLSSS